MIRKSLGIVWICACSLVVAPPAQALGEITHDSELWCEDDTIDILDMLTITQNRGACAGCDGDLDGNGWVGDTDLLILLAHWGPCPQPCDVDGNGIEDEADFDSLQTALDEGRDCAADLDFNGWVDGRDYLLAEREWTRVGGDEDAHPRVPLVDGNSTMDVLDVLRVYEAQGRDCRSDLNRDGAIDEDDLESFCRITEICSCQEVNGSLECTLRP